VWRDQEIVLIRRLEEHVVGRIVVLQVTFVVEVRVCRVVHTLRVVEEMMRVTRVKFVVIKAVGLLQVVQQMVAIV
jgi:hypothetical protein